MRRHALVSALAGFASLAAIAAASPALAGSVSFVSAKGVDNGNCGLPTAPCRTFAYALTQTNASGEIKVLDPGFYNPVLINKSVTITGVPGTSIAMLAAVTAITIDAGASGVVNLRGIDINGQGIGSSGIKVLTAKTVSIVDCAVSQVTGIGIFVTTTGNVKATISNTTSSNNGVSGIDISASGGGSVKASIDHSTTSYNGSFGVNVGPGAVTAMVTDNSSSDNGNAGFRALGASTIMHVGRNVATRNGIGIENGNSTASVHSFGTNMVRSNSLNSQGTISQITHL
jgi:hypothetical protein